jgi:GNAT superfamily N-acetyltransferase
MHHSDVCVQLFSPRFAGAFREINLAWIRGLFRVEAHDEATLSDPCALLRAGGQIFVALEGAPAPPNHAEAQVDTDDGAVLGVVALLRPSASGDVGAFEFAKMGVREGCRGRGVGRLLGEAALAYARAQGAALVDILSNRRLVPALALYKSLGFVEQPMPPSDYERADIYLILDLRAGADGKS